MSGYTPPTPVLEGRVSEIAQYRENSDNPQADRKGVGGRRRRGGGPPPLSVFCRAEKRGPLDLPAPSINARICGVIGPGERAAWPLRL